MLAYGAWVLVGIVLGGLAARWQPPSDLDVPARRAVMLAAVGGAVLGAYLLELPADLLGWAGAPPVGSGLRGPLGGRTVLGGILGGWLAVEVAKRGLGVRRPTGDPFALPLAIALACGRLGCLAAGCCAGVACAPGPWTWTDAAGGAHVPVQAIEAGFHALAAAGVVVCTRRGWLRGQRLAAYVTAYATLRFVLEFWRPHPAVLAGATWYQVLALLLLAVAGGTWWRRAYAARRAAAPAAALR